MSVRLPEWVELVAAPDRAALRALYNRAAVFVGAGHNEGWGLAASEAGLCGAALALTDNPGHAEYADHDRTALVSPIRDPAALAANILTLVRQPSLRQRLAKAARAKLSTFTWERATRAFEAGLTACLEAETPCAIAS
jgi:glycosyltransferase involved in cell wall biosynthesis